MAEPPCNHGAYYGGLDGAPTRCLICPSSSDDALLGWHVLSGEGLLGALRRCEGGESADLVMAELWANAEHEDVPDGCD